MNIQDILDTRVFTGLAEMVDAPVFGSAVIALCGIVAALAGFEFLGRPGEISKLRGRLLAVLFATGVTAGIVGMATTGLQALHLLEERNAARVSLVQEWASDTYGITLGDEAAQDIASQAASHYPKDGSSHIVDDGGEHISVVMQPDDDGTMHLFVDRDGLEPVRSR